jgi:hypothetical protein
MIISVLHDDVEIVAVNDPFIEPEYAVSGSLASDVEESISMLARYRPLAAMLTTHRPTC